MRKSWKYLFIRNFSVCANFFFPSSFKTTAAARYCRTSVESATTFTSFTREVSRSRFSTSVMEIRFSSILMIESERPFKINLPSSKNSARSAVAKPEGSFMYGEMILKHPSSPSQSFAFANGVNFSPSLLCILYAIPLVSVEP